MSPLGGPPLQFGDTFDRLRVFVETAPLSHSFHPALGWDSEKIVVTVGSNDRLASCEVSIALGRNAALSESTYAESRDWQLHLGGQMLEDPETFFGGGRRIQVRTGRDEPGDDWVLFEGFVDRLQRGWSGSSRGKTRALKLYCNSTIVAADRASGQTHFGQWRQARGGAYVTHLSGLPPVFNFAGRGNRDPLLATFGADSVPLFGDPEIGSSGAYWSIAQMLWYILWASVQPARPADVDVWQPATSQSVSSLTWTEWNLAHVKERMIDVPAAQGRIPEEIGPNLKSLVYRYLTRTDAGSPSDPQERALLRRPRDLSIDGMSTLEALAVVCDQAGIVFHPEHAIGSGGRVYTYLRFTVRGDRYIGGGMPGSVGDIEPVPSQFESDSADASVGPAGVHRTARAVSLAVSSDRSGAVGNIADAVRGDNAFEGGLTTDLSATRSSLTLVGAAAEIEMTPELLPGWVQDSFWDIAPGDATAVASAVQQAQVGSTAWDARFANADAAFTLRHVGRLWVLNEDGWFAAATYARALAGHRWAASDSWSAYKFRTTGNVFALAARGDVGWSSRRRGWRSLRTKMSGEDLRHVLFVSFDSGATWRDAKEPGVGIQWQAAEDRCAITITNGDLRTIKDPSNSAETFVTAYIRGRLRLRFAANIEGDDATLVAMSRSAVGSAPWCETIVRRTEFPARHRFSRSNPFSAAATNRLIESAAIAAVVTGENVDPFFEMDRLAEVMLDEMATPRVSGRCTIPWLWRDRKGPILGYRVGDEIVGIDTGDADTRWAFSSGAAERSPRIVCIQYTYSDEEHATELVIEDAVFGAADTIRAVGDAESMTHGRHA